MYTDELRNRISLLRKALVERPDSFDTLVETVHEILFPGSKYHQDLRSTYEILMILGETLLENENARKELAVAKTISDLPTRAHILAKNLAVEQSIQGDVNGAKICFELATISARLIDSTVERDEAIEGIIDLQLEVALYGNSVSNVKHLSGEYARSKVRAKIAKAQAIAGEFENAVLLIAEVNDVELRAPAYANVAMLQANKGQLSDAKFSFGKAAKNADQITDSFDRDVVWSKIAECLASAGLVEDALKTAKSIDDGWEYSRTLATIAVIQSSRGHKRNANEIFKQAVEAAESFNDYNNFLSGALAFIVKKMLEANELSDAKEVLGRIKDPAARSDALLTFANKHVELHQQSDARTSFTTAFEYSIKIGDNFYRPEVQVKIIDGMAGAEYFEEAIDLTSQIENESDRKRALSTIAANQAKSNLFAQAKHTLFRVDIPHLRNSVLHVLAVGQAEVGLFSDSLASLKQIPKHDTLFEKSIECLVQKMGEAGDYDNALGVIQLGGNLFTKAELCGGIACKQFISGDVRGAEKSYNTAISLASEISSDYNRYVATSKIEDAWKAAQKPQITKPSEMYEVTQVEPSDTFKNAWRSAGTHIQQLGGSELVWLRSDLHLPMAEHLSFRLGNQLFFIFVEAAEFKYSERETLFLEVAGEANAIPCIMSMVELDSTYTNSMPGWGLIHATTHELINPPDLVTNELVEMSNWELHDFAIQVVKDTLQKRGKTIFAAQSALNIDPSFWFEEGGEKYWVVVRAARYPANQAAIPANINAIKTSCAPKGKSGYFASVIVSPSSKEGKVSGQLYRGQGMLVQYDGLKSL